MVDLKGAFHSVPFASSGKAHMIGGVDTKFLSPKTSGFRYRGIPANYKFYPVPVGAQWRYRLRAWNLTTESYEIWVTVGSIDTNPPSGNPVSNVTLIGFWQE